MNKYILLFSLLIIMYSFSYSQKISDGNFILVTKEKSDKEKLSYYLKIKKMDENSFLYSLSQENHFTFNSILAVGRRVGNDVFESTNFFSNIAESYRYFDSALYEANTIEKLVFKFESNKVCSVSGFNVGLLFGKETNLSGQYRRKDNDTIILKLVDNNLEFSYTCQDDSIETDMYSQPDIKYQSSLKFILYKGEVFYYLPFYVNGFVPFLSKKNENGWLFYSDLLLHFGKLRLY